MNDKLDEYCPIKSMKIGSQDKPWINLEIKKLKRQKQREYTKRGKTTKYKKLSKLFDMKYKTAAKNFLRNKIDALKITQPGKAYKVLKDMGAQPGDCTDKHSFLLPEQ